MFNIFLLETELPTFIPLLIAIIGGFGFLVATFKTLWRKRLIDDLPTSKTQGAFIGLTELKGSAETDNPLTSYLAKIRCIYYSWAVEEHWSRTVHETYTDSKGKTQTRTRTESGWTTVASDTQSIPFYLKDDTGILRIIPNGAEIHGVTTFNQTCSPADPLYYGKGPVQQVSDSTHRRRFYETAIPLHEILYIMGQAREREDIAAAEIAYNKNAEMFLISTETEKQISTSHGILFWLYLIFGFGISVGATAIWETMNKQNPQVRWQILVIAGSIYIICFFLGWLWTVYNSLINLHHMAERGWSQVDIQLKRRYDMIPNLEKTVKGYRDHESQMQELIAKLRAQAQATPPGKKGEDYKGIAAQMFVIAENYPELKASESFRKLQNELIDTEQRIALARDYFNNTATYYNTRLSIIPDKFVGALLKLRPRVLMGASDFERASVEVKFAD